MLPRTSASPGRPRLGRPGAFLLAASLLLAAGCRDTGDEHDPRILELAHDTIRLENGRVLVVHLRAAAGTATIQPQSTTAEVGDVLRFTAGDAMTHAVAFDGAALSAEARAFLERSAQMRSPPLVDSGTAWVVSFEDAPPGTYPFTDLTHQSRGQIVVRRRGS